MTTYSPSKDLTREDAAQKLGFSPKEWKRFCGSVVSEIADQLIADGLIKPDGKSKRKVASEVVRFLRKHVDKEGEFWVMPRYDLDILAHARELRAKGKLHESCLFYQLSKLRETCRGYNDYGPFMIVDAGSNRAVDYRLTLEQAADWLNNCKKADWLTAVR